MPASPLSTGVHFYSDPAVASRTLAVVASLKSLWHRSFEIAAVDLQLHVASVTLEPFYRMQQWRRSTGIAVVESPLSQFNTAQLPLGSSRLD